MTWRTTATDSRLWFDPDGGTGSSSPAVAFHPLAQGPHQPHTPGSMPTTLRSPPIRVHLFARYADLLGADHVDLPSDDLATAGDVVARIRTLPGGRDIGTGALVAVNLRQVPLHAPVVAGDEVALLPPLAGG
jgi:molybdopterin synthase sulfur carrier subunit